MKPRRTILLIICILSSIVALVHHLQYSETAILSQNSDHVIHPTMIRIKPDGKENDHHLTSDRYNFAPSVNSSLHLRFQNNPSDTLPGKVKAAIVVLVRNDELKPWIKTMQQFEARFNRRYNYPYVFLNDQEFSESFKTLTAKTTSAKTMFGVIPKEHLTHPEWVGRKGAFNRHMSRFNSGFFHKHPLLKDYDYYWKVHPGTEFDCTLDYDPLSFMAQNNKLYGFTIAVFESSDAIPTLWRSVRKFIKDNQDILPGENTLKFIVKDSDGDYNLCHFLSSFEIGDLRFFRSPQYERFFHYLDSTGNFYSEGWSDAVIHSIAASIFLHPGQIHFFEDIGYSHDQYMHCPTSINDLVRLGCNCDPKKSFDWQDYSCLRWFYYSVKEGTKNKWVDMKQKFG